MALNLSALSTLTTTATTLSNLILVSPQVNAGITPQLSAGSQSNLDKFLFHYNGEEEMSLESDITDHFVEDNTSLQDQISLRPETYTVHGYIGELNDVAPEILQPLKTAADKLTVLTAYTPGLSTTAQIVYANALQLYQVASLVKGAAVSLWDTIGGNNTQATIVNGQLVPGNTVQNQQQKAFQKFYGWWQARTLFTVQTPYAIFKNMAIKSLRAIQSEETRMITEFQITFKPIKFASTSNPSTVGLSRFNVMTSKLVDGGVNTPPASISMADSMTRSFGSF